MQRGAGSAERSPARTEHVGALPPIESPTGAEEEKADKNERGEALLEKSEQIADEDETPNLETTC